MGRARNAGAGLVSLLGPFDGAAESVCERLVRHVLAGLCVEGDGLAWLCRGDGLSGL